MWWTAGELGSPDSLWKSRTGQPMQLVRVALFFVLLFPAPSHAVLFGAGRFDQLIQNAKIIVKARATQIHLPTHPKIDFRAEIIMVVESDGEPIPHQLFLEAPEAIWPKELGVPLAQEQVVLLVLRRKEIDKLILVNNLGAILPATTSKMRHDNRSSVTRKVFDELRAFLCQAKGETAKGLVLVHLSQLGSKEDEKMFLPYMESKNKWLRRAALACVIRINPTPKRIQMAVTDFNNHLSTPPTRSKDRVIWVHGKEVLLPPKDRLFWRIYQDVEWAARCGAWGMEKNMTVRAKAYLPIYRVLIDKAPPNYRVHIAIEALKNVGARQDIPRLYKYVGDERIWLRHDVLEGIGRILGLQIRRPQITSYCMPLPPNVQPWEKQTRATIEKILRSARLVEN